MANQITELENRFIVGNEECRYVVDTTPQDGSTAFITSGAVHEWLESLAQYSTRSVATEVSQFNQNSTDIPTVGLVYTKINDIDVTGRITSSSSDYSSSSTKIPTVGLMYSKIEALAARVAALENS